MSIIVTPNSEPLSVDFMQQKDKELLSRLLLIAKSIFTIGSILVLSTSLSSGTLAVPTTPLLSLAFSIGIAIAIFPLLTWVILQWVGLYPQWNTLVSPQTEHQIKAYLLTPQMSDWKHYYDLACKDRSLFKLEAYFIEKSFFERLNNSTPRANQ